MQDFALIEALRHGDETAFVEVVARYQASLLRVALIYVPTRALAEEAVQETWIGVLKGLRRFEGRSSLKTWLFSILMNQARTIAQREGRYEQVAFDEALEPEEAAVAPERFQNAGHWQDAPTSWDALPEAVLLSKETRRYLQKAIDGLPENQRLVITLRDVEMLTAEEVCNMLRVSETNQRVLLHRARSKVRRALEGYLHEQ